MGFLGMGNYSKPGPGISKNTPKKKRFFLFWELFLRKFSKMVWLNILYLVCCIPIVTIGPATAGFTYVLRNFAREEHSFVTSDFFEHGFRKNWKQAIAISLLDLIVLALLFLTIRFYILMMNEYDNILIPIALGISFVIAYIFISMNYFIYTLMVTMDLKLWHLIKNSFILATLSLKTSFLTTLLLALILFVLWLFFPLTLIIMFVIGLSFLGFIVIFNTYPYVQKYVINPALGITDEPAESDEIISLDKEASGSIFEDHGDETGFSDDK